jgi:hypothetical protein
MSKNHDFRHDSRCCVMEPLERRVLLSAVIEWTNRGSGGIGGDTDGFYAAFGTGWDQVARWVVDEALLAWERVIESFNYPSGSDKLGVNINIDLSTDGFGGGATPTTYQNSIPRTGRITIHGGDADAGPTRGWFLGVTEIDFPFDPNDLPPFDHSAFLRTPLNAFVGRAHAGSPAAGQADLFSLVVIEMAHVLGMTSDTDSWFQKSGLLTDTKIKDDSFGGNVGTYFVFNGPSIDHLMTSNNGGGDGTDKGVATHTAGPPIGPNQPLEFQGKTYIGSYDAGNALYAGGRRYLPSKVMQLILRDTYLYTTNDPAIFGTFYANLNRSTGELLVQGADGDAGDTFSITHFLGELHVSVNLENDVPGTGHLPGTGNLPAWTSRFDPADVQKITINAGGGDDTIHIIDLPSGVPVTVNTGSGNNTVSVGIGPGIAAGSPITINSQSGANNQIHVSPNLVASPVWIVGNGNDQVLVSDLTTPGGHNYEIYPVGLGRDGFGGLLYSGLDQLTLQAANGGNIIRINGTAAGTRTSIHLGDGSDEVYVGDGDIAGNIGGELSVIGKPFGGPYSLSFLDDSSTGNNTYRLHTGPSRLEMTGLANDIGFALIDQIVLAANDFNNSIHVNGVLSGTTMSVTGGGGNDTIFVGNGRIRSNIRGDLLVVGGPGSNTMWLQDRLETLDQDANYLFDLNTFSRHLTPPILYTSIQETILETSDFGNTITVEATVPGAAVTVLAGKGSNHLRVHPPGMNLNSVPALVTLHGLMSNDRATVVDSFAAGNQSWTITNQLVSRPGFGGLRYLGQLGRISLQAGNGDDTFDIMGTSAGLADGMLLFGADGRDSFIVHQPPGSPLFINGDQPFSSPGDSLAVFGAGTTGVYLPSPTIAGFGTVMSNGMPIAFTGIEDWVSVENFAQFSLIAPNSEDVIDIHSLPAQQRNIISGTSGGVSFTPLRFRDVAEFILDTATNDEVGPGSSANDLITIHPDGGLLAANLNRFLYKGGTGLDRLIVNAGTYHFDHDARDYTQELTIEVNTDGQGTAEVIFDHTQHLAGLILGREGYVEITHTGQEPSKVVVTRLLQISGDAQPAGRIDVKDNDMIITRTLGAAPSTFLNVWQWVRAGYNNGAWNGMGITSSTAAVNRLRDTAVGVGPNEALGYTEFSGEPVTPVDILVKYTWYGDANLDGQVTIADLGLLAGNWQQTPRYWHHGDYNYDTLVDIADLGILSANWQKGVGAPLFRDGSMIGDDDDDEAAAGHLAGSAAKNAALGRAREVGVISDGRR